MAKAAFEVFCLNGGLNPDLDAHPACTKALWRKIQTAAFDSLDPYCTIRRRDGLERQADELTNEKEQL